MNITEELLQMKNQANKAKDELFRLEGSLDQLYKILKKDHNCETLKAVDVKLLEMNQELDQKELDLKQGIKELRENYVWD